MSAVVSVAEEILEDLRKKALSLETAEEIAGAIEAWRTVLAAAPGDLDALRRLSKLLMRARRMEEAVQALETLVAADPADEKSRKRLETLRLRADPAQHEAMLRRRILDDPQDRAAHLQLAGLLARDDRPNELLEVLLLDAQANPQDISAWKRLADARMSYGTRTTTGGVKVFGLGVQEALHKALEIDPNDTDCHAKLAKLLFLMKRPEEAVPHLHTVARASGGALAGASAIIQDGQDTILFEQDGQVEKTSYAFYRGEHTNFTPTDRSFRRANVLQDYFTKGLMPAEPFIDEDTRIVAFGSCFATHISSYLDRLGYYVMTRRQTGSYLNTMGDGIVNTYAIRQQFEWAWMDKQPQVELWHGYDAKALGYEEEPRLATQMMFDAGEVFIVTLGLSEVWYDEPTGEVFWRAVPREHFDPSRHKFRVTTHAENLANLRAIHRLIRERRPDATIVFTLSPIALAATFRPIAATAADTASKAILRAALDEFFNEAGPGDERLFYFPSYEIALRAFEHPLTNDRRHVHNHVLDLNMSVFERYYCKTGLTDEALSERFTLARELDAKVFDKGHKSVARGGARRAGQTFG